MVAKWIELVTGSLEDKRRYKQYKARAQQMPASYRTAIEAIDRYLTYRGAITDGDTLIRMLEDLGNLFDQSIADGTSVHAIVGDDPVEFAEEFLRNYSDAEWINKERSRLVAEIRRAEAADGTGA